MEQYKLDFIKFLANQGMLTFGDRELKSKRISPYFVNTGSADDGNSAIRLGMAYAGGLHSKVEAGKLPKFDFLFGPPYKGIGLIIGTAIALANFYSMNVKYSYNRKEAKDHAEKGFIVGYQFKNKDIGILVDDVFTTGDTKEEAVRIMRAVAPDVQIAGLIIGVDRCETNKDGGNAIADFEKEFKIPVTSIVNAYEIKEAVQDRVITPKDVNGTELLHDKIVTDMEAYLNRYGVKEV